MGKAIDVITYGTIEANSTSPTNLEYCSISVFGVRYIKGICDKKNDTEQLAVENPWKLVWFWIKTLILIKI